MVPSHALTHRVSLTHMSPCTVAGWGGRREEMVPVLTSQMRGTKSPAPAERREGGREEGREVGLNLTTRTVPVVYNVYKRMF